MASELAAKTAPEVQSDGLSKGERTRNRILDLTYDSSSARASPPPWSRRPVSPRAGSSTTSRTRTISRAILIERYTAENEVFLDGLIGRARELGDDPLHSHVIFLKLFAEAISEVFAVHPGCLVAIITFQDQAFDRAVSTMNSEGVMA
jgi:hypothetical protein